MCEGISARKAIESDSKLHHDLLVLHTVVFYVSSRVLVDVEWIYDAEG